MSTDPTQIDKSRSPDAPNLISDSGGFPEKRPGWRVLHNFGARIHGIYHGRLADEDVFLVHAGETLYRWDGADGAEVLRSGLNNGSGTAFCLEDRLWILTGREYLVYGKFDGAFALKDVESIAYVPATSISVKPANPQDRKNYEPANLLQPKRINKFIGDGTTKDYQLDVTGIDSAAVTATVNGTEMAEGSGFTVDRTAGKITFATAPTTPGTTGVDNVFINFSKTVEGYADRVKRCTIATLYGVGNNDRAFLAGDPQNPSTDRWSWYKNPAYFPDNNASALGTRETRIMGYSKIGEYLAIHKEDSSVDSTIYLRRAALIPEDDRKTQDTGAFPTVQGVSGIGTIAPGAVASLIDEPLFLSRTGVYGIGSSTITAERNAVNRSYFVDAALTKEPNLQSAVAAQWNGCYLLCVNGRCYVLDGKQQKAYRSQMGDYVYECYFWNNVPAVCLLEHEGSLYFGAADGRVCRFNNDIDGMAKYNDNGAAIACWWSTKADDDGDFMVKKTMVRRGSGIMIKPYTRSSARVLIRTDRDFGREIKYAPMDIFDWEDIDFARFTFNAGDSPQVVPFSTKVGKYVTAQIIIKNDSINEGFGVFGIIKRYTKADYVK